MDFLKRKKAILILEDGSTWSGLLYGADTEAQGEICFNTGMTGYQEIFTDPSYLGQILVTTNVHIGNYGINDKEVESNSVKISALICRNFSIPYNRKNSNGDIQKYLLENNIPVIANVDTRALVRHIRNKGAMNGIVSTDLDSIDSLKDKVKNIPSMNGLQLSDKVSTKEIYYQGNESSKIRISVLDLGLKQSIVDCLVERGAYCKVYPMGHTAEQILDWQPHGVMITNGPGDPAAMKEVINEVSVLLGANVPVFGICLGHQVICLAKGLSTVKMFNGHRGINHPVYNLITERAEITSQNHGFVVQDQFEDKDIMITHRHLNDNSIAGIKFIDKPIFSVQYHPEASAGPHDSRYLFDEFIELANQFSSVN